MKKVAALLALALVSAALLACGDDGDGTTATAGGGAATNGAASDSGGTSGDGQVHGEPIPIEADPNGRLAYTTDRVTVKKAGNVSLEFNNPQAVAHDVVIEDAGGSEVGRTQLIAEGFESVTITDVESGRYAFYCSVPGHREAGMEGTLVVE